MGEATEGILLPLFAKRGEGRGEKSKSLPLTLTLSPLCGARECFWWGHCAAMSTVGPAVRPYHAATRGNIFTGDYAAGWQIPSSRTSIFLAFSRESG